MKVIIEILCLTLLVFGATTEAWQARGNYQNSAHPGKCVIKPSLILSPGQTVKDPDSCATIECTSAKGDAIHTGCISVGAPQNCEWDGFENERAAFPVCCVQKVKCQNAANLPEALKYQKHIRDMFAGQIKN